MERQGSRQDFGRGDSRSWVGPDGALAINVLSVCTVPTRHGPLYSLDYDYDFQATQCLKREATATAATGEPPNFLFLLVVVVDGFFFLSRVLCACLSVCVWTKKEAKVEAVGSPGDGAEADRPMNTTGGPSVLGRP